MKNNTISPKLNTSNIHITDVYSSNKAILMQLGAITDHYMRLNGLSDMSLSKRVGCSSTMIWKLRKGKVDFCGISLISRIAISFGYTLADWLQVKQPKDTDSVFGALKP